MPSEKTIVLLDTMIVAGLYAVTKQSSTNPHLITDKNTWKSIISDAVSSLNHKVEFAVPTSVCYELMCWNKEWREFVLSGKDPLFKYANYSISSSILQTAAKYSIDCSVQFFDDRKYKVKGMDPLTAAYSLNFGHYILTENQQDFPDSHFEVVSVNTRSFKQKKGTLRKVIFLMKPRIN